MLKQRNKQYHEIDKIELKGSGIAARLVSRLRSKIQVAFEKRDYNLDISQDIVNGILVPLITASIVSDLKGRKRSFLFADESFNLQTLELAHKKDKKKKGIVKRVVRLPVKKFFKGQAVKVTIENVPEEVQEGYQKVKKIYKEGKKLKKKIEKIPIQKVGEKSQIKKVPEPERIKRKKRFKQFLNEEHARINEEVKQKIKQERKYIYDEVIRHLRVILKDVTVETVKIVNWQEVLDRLTNDERNIEDIKSLIKFEQIEVSTTKVITKLINKISRKIRDKKERAKKELQAKIIKESSRAGKEYIYKPLKRKLRLEERIFGTPRRAGSHRQYRSTYYYIAKSLQELEKGQRRRRQYETVKYILGALGGIADLVGFLADYNIKDVFVLLTELGGATYFPETYKIGGIVKAANYISLVASTLEKYEDEAENRVREYQVKRVLRLIQELKTIKKLFSRYYPPVYNILQNASRKTNDNLRQVVNNLILSGATNKEAVSVLTEAFKTNGLDASEPFRLETIFRTQAALAYSAGRWQSDQHAAIQEILWGYRYVTVGDNRVRPEHRILDGVTLPKDDEFWLYFWPPNGWNCRCSVISLFEEREIVLPPEDWKGLAEIDQDFTFNPGLIFTDAFAKFA